VALEPQTGRIAWKYNVGPKPERLDPRLLSPGVLHGQALIGLPTIGKERSPEVVATRPAVAWPSRRIAGRRRYDGRKRYGHPGARVLREDVVGDVPP
jgi:hypothetical protein